jgi:hypothetical protein
MGSKIKTGFEEMKAIELEANQEETEAVAVPYK